jgi:hypothetical protein
LPTRQNSPRLEGRNDVTISTVFEAWRPPIGVDETSDDPARTVVMAAFHALVDSGMALWTTLESGDVRISCEWGAVYHLDEYGVTRVR